MTPKAKRYADLIGAVMSARDVVECREVIESFEQDAERRAYRSLARWAVRESTYYSDGSAVGEMLRYGVAAECRRRAKGKS